MASLPFCLFPFPACLARPRHSQPFARAVNFTRSATSHEKPRRLLQTCALTRPCSCDSATSPPTGLQPRSTSWHFVAAHSLVLSVGLFLWVCFSLSSHSYYSSPDFSFLTEGRALFTASRLLGAHHIDDWGFNLVFSERGQRKARSTSLSDTINSICLLPCSW